MKVRKMIGEMNKIRTWIKLLCASYLHEKYGLHILDATKIAHVDPEKYPFCIVCKKPYSIIIEKSHSLAWYYAESVGKKLI